MMNPLTDKQEIFIRQYDHWLETVNDGLMTVIQFYREGHDEPADRLLTEMMTGFDRFDEENMTMYSVFGQDEKRSREWSVFHQHINDAKEIPAEDDSAKKMAQLSKKTLPAFNRWRIVVQSTLSEA